MGQVSRATVSAAIVGDEGDSIQCEIISSWQELAELAAETATASVLFRGQSKNWVLLPSVGRPGIRRTASGDSAPYSCKEERFIVEEFKRRATPYIQ
jgi:hypothetical protein